MIKRIVFIASVAALLLSSQAVSADAPVITVGNSSPWGHWIMYHTEPNTMSGPTIHVVWDPGDTSAQVYCGVTSHTPNIAVPSDWVPIFEIHPPATDFFLQGCITKYILIATFAQPQMVNFWVIPNQSPPPR